MLTFKSNFLIISIIGIGYVGLVTGVCFAKLGNNVICVDVDEKKIEMINRGVPPIYEEGLEQLLVENKGRIEGTRDYEYAIQNTDVTFICVGTPSKDDGSIDLKFVKEAAEEIGKQLSVGATFWEKSWSGFWCGNESRVFARGDSC